METAAETTSNTATVLLPHENQELVRHPSAPPIRATHPHYAPDGGSWATVPGTRTEAARTDRVKKTVPAPVSGTDPRKDSSKAPARPQQGPHPLDGPGRTGARGPCPKPVLVGAIR
jgi:hypothetical protein